MALQAPVAAGRYGKAKLLFGLILLLGAAACRAELAPPPPDPAGELRRPVLEAGERSKVRALFEKLSARDFETRQSALRQLVARGPAVLPLAKEYAQRDNEETATQAQGLRGRILRQYDGYLPPSPSLQKALQQKVALKNGATESPLAALKKIAQAAGIPLLFDPRFAPRDVTRGVFGIAGILPGKPRKTEGQAGALLTEYARRIGLAAIPRGGMMLLTSPASAGRLRRQRYIFDWKRLGFDRREAARIGAGLKIFFPSPSTEMHTGSEALSIRGTAGEIERAARLIALLKPGAPAALWPPGGALLDAKAAAEALAQPVSVRLLDDDLAYALDDFRKQGHLVRVRAHGRVFEQPPYPAVFRGLAPVRLKLKDVPLGLALRWLAARAAFVGREKDLYRLEGGVDASGRIQLRVASKERGLSALSVGGLGVSWLTPRNLPDGEKADQVLEKRLRKALAPHLELFPGFVPETDLRVLRGRVLFQGSPAAVAWAIELLRRWKAEGRVPPCAWYEKMRANLARVVEWDGRGLSAGRLLSRLRTLGRFAILLQPSPEGDPAYFRLTRKQAELLPPGRYSPRALLDDLARKASARWSVRWGVIVMEPSAKPKAAKETP